ncbi:unnamed protein product [Bemisia tabaci]|uniref:Small-subunit processome Utp12 domain-containing protein n=1 Tax=Bemisia tabaci TaxID=7038 RepID=A0AAI8UU25_BEMTA|nr:unnamed protein product [Bemisia tabaci]
MSDSTLSTFSTCGKYFSSFGADGKLRIWDTLSNTLKQEYTPNMHLTSPITSLKWIKLSNPTYPTKIKRKSMDDNPLESDILLLGTRNGQLQFYSVSSGEVSNELAKSHDSAITCMAWCKSVNYVYTASEDSHILEWSLKKNKMKKKWFAGTGRITSLALSGDGSYLYSASRSIQWWDLESKSVIKKFTGHSSAITSLSHVSTLSGNYLLSAAKDDKFISAWSLNESNDEKTSIASFVLDDTAAEMSVFAEDDGASATMMALSSSGTLHTFKLKLNGKCSKSVKADHIIQLAPNEGSKTLSLSPIPICSSLPKSDSSVLIAYGSGVLLKFETIAIDSPETLIILVRKDTRKKVSIKNQDSLKVVSASTADASYSHPGVVNGSNSVDLKRNSSSKLKDLPMEERLENLQLNKIDTPAGSSVPPDSLAQLLIQGLKSKDKNILYSVLSSRSEEIVNNTVARLPVQVILPLVEQLTSLTQSKSWGSEVAVRWLKCILSVHSAQLLASPDLSSKLSPLLGLIETRLNALPPLLRLRGRLDLLLDQFSGKPSVPITSYDQSDFLVYEDKDSDEEEGSDDIRMGHTTDSSGEDRWDELSDEESVDGNGEDVEMASD